MKTRLTKRKRRLISAILAMVLCLLSCPLYAAAETSDVTGELILPSDVTDGVLESLDGANALTWTPNDLFVLEAGDKTLSELAEMTLNK